MGKQCRVGTIFYSLTSVGFIILKLFRCGCSAGEATVWFPLQSEVVPLCLKRGIKKQPDSFMDYIKALCFNVIILVTFLVTEYLSFCESHL